MCGTDDQARKQSTRRRDSISPQMGEPDRVREALRMQPDDGLQLGGRQADPSSLLAAADRGWSRSGICTAHRAGCNRRQGRSFLSRCRVNRGLETSNVVDLSTRTATLAGDAGRVVVTVHVGSNDGEASSFGSACAAHGTVLKESTFERAIRVSLPVVMARSITSLATCPPCSDVIASPPELRDDVAVPFRRLSSTSRSRHAFQSTTNTRRRGASTGETARHLRAA